jgi:DNA-directed RNA polymerase specialized sigma24 family protein
MATMLDAITLPSTGSSQSAMWSLLLLEHLEEFAKLVWYLVADGRLVDETFSRTMVQLSATPFDTSDPKPAYDHAREVLISQAIRVLASIRREEAESGIAMSTDLGGLPDLPRLAFMLRFVVHSSEMEVASLLEVSPKSVREFVRDVVEHLCTEVPFSFLAVCHDAWAS